MNRVLGYVSIILFNWIIVSAYGYEALHPTMDLGFQQALASYYFGLGDGGKKINEGFFSESGPFTGQQLFKLYLPRKYFLSVSHYENRYLQLQVKEKGGSLGLMTECYTVDAPYWKKKSWLFDNRFTDFSQNLDVWILDFNSNGEASLLRGEEDRGDTSGPENSDNETDGELEMICSRSEDSYALERESLSDNDTESVESRHYMSEAESVLSGNDSRSSAGTSCSSCSCSCSCSCSSWSFCSSCSTCCNSNPNDLAIEGAEGWDDAFVLNSDDRNLPPVLESQNHYVIDNIDAHGEQSQPPDLLDRDGNVVVTVRSSEPTENGGNTERKNIFDLARD